jgi:hypothetical protein
MVLFLLLTFYLIRYREYFPIKERSPYLTIISLIGIYGVLETYPLPILFDHFSLVLSSAFYGIFMEIYITAITFKHFRLGYAFNYKNQCMNWMLRYEWLLVAILVA